MADEMTLVGKMKHMILIAVASLVIGGMSSVSAQTAPSSSVPFEMAVKEAAWLTGLYPTWNIYRGEGESMHPHYGGHSLLIVNETNISAVKSGMIVLFEDAEGDRVAHLVERSEAGELWTRGANNPSTDPATVTAENFIGVIVGVMHTDRNSIPDTTIPVAIGKTY